MLSDTPENNVDERSQFNQCLPLLTYVSSIGGVLFSTIGSVIVTPVTIITAGTSSCLTFTTLCHNSLGFFSTTPASERSKNVNNHSVSEPLLMNIN
ncbi:hypothetical protein ACNVED_15035 (plasmid) [Legionella sp. D16C41]|uniref:hypothetical protein n=1 Tax=Legionella sp. D16C41 TaxID=3402688 RepID=UPI003AF41E8E